MHIASSVAIDSKSGSRSPRQCHSISRAINPITTARAPHISSNATSRVGIVFLLGSPAMPPCASVIFRSCKGLLLRAPDARITRSPSPFDQHIVTCLLGIAAIWIKLLIVETAFTRRIVLSWHDKMPVSVLAVCFFDMFVTYHHSITAPASSFRMVLKSATVQ